MTTLFYAPGACSLAPHIVLEWIGQPYDAQRAKYGSAELLAVNPTGAVPALREDDGWILTQASAILEYLAQKHPEAGLGGNGDPRHAAELHKWNAFLTSDLHAAYWPFFMTDRFTTDGDKTARAAVVEAARLMIAKKLTILDDHMQGRDWMVGDGKGQRSIADAYIFPMIRWAKAVFPDDLARWPNLNALRDRISADEGVQRVLADEASKG